MKYYLILDTETGGLNPKENPVLELAAGVYDEKGESKDCIYATFYPYLPMNCKALAVNQFFNRVEIPTSDECSSHNKKEVTRIVKWSSSIYKKFNPIIVGQNLKFDLEFMDSLMGYYGINDWSKMWSYPTLDTAQMAYLLREMGLLKVDKLNLNCLAKAYQIENTNAHTAMSDVETTAALFFAMLKQVQKVADTSREGTS